MASCKIDPIMRSVRIYPEPMLTTSQSQLHEAAPGPEITWRLALRYFYCSPIAIVMNLYLRGNVSGQSLPDSAPLGVPKKPASGPASGSAGCLTATTRRTHVAMSSLGVSVAQAILQRQGQSRLTTSSQRLDGAFVSRHPANNGGIARGTVGEIVGPPGIGKTTLAYAAVWHEIALTILDYRLLPM